MGTENNAELVKAWANGEEVQWWDEQYGEWRDCNDHWDNNDQHRLKPNEPVQPQVINKWQWVWGNNVGEQWLSDDFLTEDEARAKAQESSNELIAYAPWSGIEITR